MRDDLPIDYVNRIQSQLKGEAESFLSCYDRECVRSLRLNPLKKQVYINNKIGEYFPTANETVPWEEAGRYYEESDAPGRSPLHATGLYYIQEASAMAPAALLMKEPLRDGERILDLCAAPGGKSTQIAGYMRDRGLLVCNEIVLQRARILSENIERLCVKNGIVTAHAPDFLRERFHGFFTRILVDAPCSGEGMFRKHPEAALEWSPENVELCAKRQDDILDAAADMLMPGGTLVYSTCTFSREEDEGSVERFLERHGDFELVDITQTQKKPIHLYPHKVRGEGQFMALLKKEGSLPDVIQPPYHTGIKRPDKKQLRLYRDEILCYIKLDYVNANGLAEPENLALFGNNLYLIPEGMPDISGVKVLRCGLALGSFEKNRFEPAHALALALSGDAVTSYVNLSMDEAQQYLKGMTIKVPGDGQKKGWCLMLCNGLSIGWGKCSGDIIKNHYPKGLRLP